jgi:hypothetical protein
VKIYKDAKKQFTLINVIICNCQIWLNNILDGCHSTYITNLGERKKKTAKPVYFGSISLMILFEPGL